MLTSTLLLQFHWCISWERSWTKCIILLKRVWLTVVYISTKVGLLPPAFFLNLHPLSLKALYIYRNIFFFTVNVKCLCNWTVHLRADHSCNVSITYEPSWIIWRITNWKTATSPGTLAILHQKQSIKMYIYHLGSSITQNTTASESNTHY